MENIQIIITSTQEVDNVIKIKLGINSLAGPSAVGVIETNGNIGIYRTRVFHGMYETNQSYFYERLSPPSMGR